ncbi:MULTISPECIES: right-handed parallel beta-helix repeat-containing protein [unclassified Saccharicrinis]|uniref:right-handed parallel beta-helix repeat-containing protein n=1 Tax=unclassified Saccharicrinis TaxID=2646859 RepID=UPI003D350DCC
MKIKTTFIVAVLLCGFTMLTYAQQSPFLNIKDFGAKGDGKTDDTPALLMAMEAATKSEGTVYFPQGNYGIHPVTVPGHITLLGYSAWSYANKDKRDPDYIGKTILTALSGDARALLDLGSNRGIRVFGLTLDGKKLGDGMHGVYARHSECEQNNCIEDCRIQHFSGSGIRLERSWVFGVRRCLLMFNGEHGIDLTGGYDGWVIDNQLTANKGFGLFARGTPAEGMTKEEIKDLKFFGTASVMVTANRIEWNKSGGVYLNGSNSMQITGCAIDHNFGPGIKISNGTAHAVSGNLLRSNGVDAKDDHCSQIWLENINGASVTGNTIWGWYNRKEYKFEYPYPFYGIIAKNLNGCVISQNAMYHSSSKEGVSDRGGNENSIIKDNAYVKPVIEEVEGSFRMVK